MWLKFRWCDGPGTKGCSYDGKIEAEKQVQVLGMRVVKKRLNTMASICSQRPAKTGVSPSALMSDMNLLHGVMHSV